MISTSLKNLKNAENYFTSPADLKDVKRVKHKKNSKAQAQGQVKPKISVASPAIEERMTTNEKGQQQEPNASSISSIKPYGFKLENADDTDMSATRFVCNHTTSPSKVSPEKSGVRDKKESMVAPSELSKRQTLTAKKMQNVVEEQAIHTSPGPAEMSRNTNTCGSKLEAQDQIQSFLETLNNLEAFDAKCREQKLQLQGGFQNQNVHVNQAKGKRFDRDTLNFSNSSIMLESSAMQLKEQLVRYKERINESFAVLGGDNKTIISQISGHNNSGLLLGLNSTRHAVTHRNKPENAVSKEQTFKSLYYQDSLGEAIQVIIKKLDEKIESTNQSKVLCPDKPANISGLNIHQEGSIAGDSNTDQGAKT